MWLLISQRTMLNGGSQTGPGHKGPLCHVALLKHPAPMGDHLDFPAAPHGLRYSNTLCFTTPHCLEKKSILNKVETGFPLHRRKAHFRARLNTLKPQGNDEIKHQRHVLYVSQEKNKKNTGRVYYIWPSGFLHVYVCRTQLHTSMRPHLVQRSCCHLRAY